MEEARDSKESQRGFDRYSMYLLSYATSFQAPIWKRERAPADVTDEEAALFDSVYRRFAEVKEAVNRLDLCLLFIEARRPRQLEISPDDYLRYHIGCYLQEIYILRERLTLYGKVICRLIKKGRTKSERGEIEARFERWKSMIESSMSGVVSTRGMHVHQRYFDDESLDLLSTTHAASTLLDDTKKSMFARHAQELYRESKR